MNGKSQVILTTVSIILIVVLVGCTAQSAPAASKGLIAVRVGYVPNITHSQALVGLARGNFQKGSDQHDNRVPQVAGAMCSKHSGNFALDTVANADIILLVSFVYLS